MQASQGKACSRVLCFALDHFIHRQSNALAFNSLSIMPSVEPRDIGRGERYPTASSPLCIRSRRHPVGHQILLPRPARVQRCDDHGLKTAEHPRPGAIITRLLLRLRPWLLEDRKVQPVVVLRPLCCQRLFWCSRLRGSTSPPTYGSGRLHLRRPAFNDKEEATRP